MNCRVSRIGHDRLRDRERLADTRFEGADRGGCAGGKLGFTGVLAVIFLFLAGGYRTIQKRWPDRWGPILPVWAHSNLSLAAAVFVSSLDHSPSGGGLGIQMTKIT